MMAGVIAVSGGLARHSTRARHCECDQRRGYAALDRSAVLISDGFDADEKRYVTHQVFDQRPGLGPVTKGAARLTGWRL
jgi:hypothetical protein